MRSIDTIAARLAAIRAQIEENKHPRPVIDLPFAFFDDEGNAWPGCEESNARAYQTAAALGIGVSAHAGIGPDDDGVNP